MSRAANLKIKCPDKACEAEDCPKCVTICKQPHCVTHCQVSSSMFVNQRRPNRNAKLSVKNQDVTGNAPSPNAPNLNASWFAKIPTASLRLPAVDAMARLWDKPPSSSSRKLKKTQPAVNAEADYHIYKSSFNFY